MDNFQYGFPQINNGIVEEYRNTGFERRCVDVDEYIMQLNNHGDSNASLQRVKVIRQNLLDGVANHDIWNMVLDKNIRTTSFVTDRTSCPNKLHNDTRLPPIEVKQKKHVSFHSSVKPTWSQIPKDSRLPPVVPIPKKNESMPMFRSIQRGAIPNTVSQGQLPLLHSKKPEAKTNSSIIGTKNPNVKRTNGVKLPPLAPKKKDLTSVSSQTDLRHTVKKTHIPPPKQQPTLKESEPRFAERPPTSNGRNTMKESALNNILMEVIADHYLLKRPINIMQLVQKVSKISPTFLAKFPPNLRIQQFLTPRLAERIRSNFPTVKNALKLENVKLNHNGFPIRSNFLRKGEGHIHDFMKVKPVRKNEYTD